jgi:hypothetical protein
VDSHAQGEDVLVPPPFAPTHSWACPIWRWAYWRNTTLPGSIFESAHSNTSASTTMLYVANSWSVPISIHVDCYLSDGTLETGVTCSGPVGARQRLKAALNPTRTPAMDANGDFSDMGEGWFQLWSNGPVTPAAMTKVVLGMPGWIQELVVPVEPVELEPAAVEVAPVHVEVEAAPEGGGGAVDELAHLSLPEAMAWFESVRSGRRIHHGEK